MRLDKVKAIVKKDGWAALVDTDPEENMIGQWIGSGHAMYPVRGVALTQDLALAAWGLEPDKWDGKWLTLSHKAIAAMEMAEPIIDELTAPDNIIGTVNGWLVVRGKGGKGYAVDPARLAPCKEKGNLHLLPIDGTAWLLVYDGPELAGLVAAADQSHTKQVLDVANRAGRLVALEPEEAGENLE